MKGHENILWINEAGEDSQPSLTDHIKTDTLIIGAGITGLTAAFNLTANQRDVVIIEAETIGNTATSKSSAHLTTESDNSYHVIASKFNKDVAKMVAGSRNFAISYISEMAENFPCDFSYVSGYLYSENGGDLEKEFESAQEAGLDVTYADKLLLPFPVKKAIEFPKQGIFNPYKYSRALAGYLSELSNCQIYENTRAIRKEGNKIYTDDGSIEARSIIYATQYPLFTSAHQLMAYPYRSYIIVAKVKEDIGDSLYWDMADPYHYTRTYFEGDNKWLIVGGADHKTGETTDGFRELETYLRQRYQVEEIAWKWSSQYYEPADGLPYIGRNFSGDEFIGTGYSGDGLIYGTLGGIIISNEILGSKLNLWDNIYDSRRIKPIASSGKFTRENLSVLTHMIRDRIRAKKSKLIKEIKFGEGMVITHNHEKIAVTRNDDGSLLQLSAICPHLKCVVKWNELEHSWDCPCHGSRFSYKGEVITGPATTNLNAIEVKDRLLV